MTAVEMRAYRGTAVFSAGFRPFFLLGALWAGVAVPAWVLAHLLGDSTLWGLPGRDWHVLEMLFGYVAAVIAGFLLTAVPNWTGRLPSPGGRSVARPHLDPLIPACAGMGGTAMGAYPPPILGIRQTSLSEPSAAP